MGVKKSNLLLWVATTLEILSRGRGTKKVKNRCCTVSFFILYSFISSEKDSSLPYCFVCSTMLSNEAMVLSKLERHLTKNHPELKDKPKDYFEKLRFNIQCRSA